MCGDDINEKYSVEVLEKFLYIFSTFFLLLKSGWCEIAHNRYTYDA